MKAPFDLDVYLFWYRGHIDHGSRKEADWKFVQEQFKQHHALKALFDLDVYFVGGEVR